MFTRLTCAIPALLAFFALSPLADAGGIAVGFSKHGKHTSVGVSIGFPVCEPAPRPPRYGGHWETVVERVWVPGVNEQVWVPARFETRYDACGRPYQVCVRAGYWRTVCTPGRWEDRPRQVWRAAAWRRR